MKKTLFAASMLLASQMFASDDSAKQVPAKKSILDAIKDQVKALPRNCGVQAAATVAAVHAASKYGVLSQHSPKESVIQGCCLFAALKGGYSIYNNGLTARNGLTTVAGVAGTALTFKK